MYLKQMIKLLPSEESEMCTKVINEVRTEPVEPIKFLF